MHIFGAEPNFKPRQQTSLGFDDTISLLELSLFSVPLMPNFLRTKSTVDLHRKRYFFQVWQKFVLIFDGLKIKDVLLTLIVCFENETGNQ